MEHFNYPDMELLSMALPEEILRFKYSGDFRGEIAALDAYMECHPCTEALLRRLKLEKIIAAGMDDEYNVSEEELIDSIRRDFPAFDEKALEHCIRQGWAEYILREGKRIYLHSTRSSLVDSHSQWMYGLDGRKPNGYVDWRIENTAHMLEKGGRAYRYRVRFSIRPTGEAIREGKKLRIFLPFPQECEEQSEIRLIGSSHPVTISRADQRTAFMEPVCKAEEWYWIELEYVNRSVCVHPDPAQVSPEQPDFYTGEQLPHIAFTPYLRSLAAEIAGEETNPLILARKVYNWITENISYSFMRDYAFMDCISENCALNGRGDCGVQALLFITLCRILGIPARWQSGCSVRPGYIGSHDWAQYYVAPFGWLHADPSYGGGLVSIGHPELRDYYAVNLDCFRLITCRDFQKPFEPERFYFREDPYDNQSGEIEYEDEYIAPDNFETRRETLSAEEIPF